MFFVETHRSASPPWLWGGGLGGVWWLEFLGLVVWGWRRIAMRLYRGVLSLYSSHTSKFRTIQSPHSIPVLKSHSHSQLELVGIATEGRYTGVGIDGIGVGLRGGIEVFDGVNIDVAQVVVDAIATADEVADIE